jgi:L-amino acid N-acyltransferase YncA
MVTLRPAADDRDLEAILALQRANLERNLARLDDGHVTLEHTLETLRQMQRAEPSHVAVDGATLAGYALVLVPGLRAVFPDLEPMFALADRLEFRGRPIAASRYYVMGQVCVAPPYRGTGVFDALYRAHAAALRGRFELVVTEVATRNLRSLRAHQRVGFERLATHRDATDEWAVVAWDLVVRS